MDIPEEIMEEIKYKISQIKEPCPEDEQYECMTCCGREYFTVYDYFIESWKHQ